MIILSKPLRSYRSKAGSVVVSFVSSPLATWTCLVVLLSIHLAANHAAVKAVSLHSLNRQRANIVLSDIFDGREVPTPETVSVHERIFEWDGVLRWRNSAAFASARIGISLQEMLKMIAPAHHVTSAIRDNDSVLENLIRIHQGQDFLLWYCKVHKTAYIVLKKGSLAKTHLKAWAVGLRVAHQLKDIDATSATADKVLQVITSTITEISVQWDDYVRRIRAAGWDTEIASLETTSGKRIFFHTRTSHEDSERKAW